MMTEERITVYPPTGAYSERDSPIASASDLNLIFCSAF